MFSISDTGIGLKPGEIHRLFRPFTQANADIARRYGGTGLGLMVVKALAQRMGGDLTVTSTYGEGSTFRFSVQVGIAVARTKREEPPPQRSRAIPARRFTILCAEDNPYGRVILNTILTELGHRADFAGSGEEAIAAVTRGYDAVLMDVTLPGIDGLEATRRMRALASPVGQTPIIGISGRSEAGDEAAARAAGMNAYLRKPLSPKALSDALAAFCRSRAERSCRLGPAPCRGRVPELLVGATWPAVCAGGHGQANSFPRRQLDERSDPLGIRQRRGIVDHHAEIGPAVDREGRVFESDRSERSDAADV